MDREYWYKILLDEIKDFSDEDYQRRAWFGEIENVSSPEGGIVSSPGEMFCTLYDDLMLSEFLSEHGSTLSKRQRESFAELDMKLNNFIEETGNSLDPRDVLSDPRWREIRSAAQRVLDTIK